MKRRLDIQLRILHILSETHNVKSLLFCTMFSAFICTQIMSEAGKIMMCLSFLCNAMQKIMATNNQVIYRDTFLGIIQTSGRVLEPIRFLSVVTLIDPMAVPICHHSRIYQRLFTVIVESSTLLPSWRTSSWLCFFMTKTLWLHIRVCTTEPSRTIYVLL